MCPQALIEGVTPNTKIGKSIQQVLEQFCEYSHSEATLQVKDLLVADYDIPDVEVFSETPAAEAGTKPALIAFEFSSPQSHEEKKPALHDWFNKTVDTVHKLISPQAFDCQIPKDNVDTLSFTLSHTQLNDLLTALKIAPVDDLHSQALSFVSPIRSAESISIPAATVSEDYQAALQDSIAQFEECIKRSPGAPESFRFRSIPSQPEGIWIPLSSLSEEPTQKDYLAARALGGMVKAITNATLKPSLFPYSTPQTSYWLFFPATLPIIHTILDQAPLEPLPIDARSTIKDTLLALPFDIQDLCLYRTTSNDSNGASFFGGIPHYLNDDLECLDDEESGFVMVNPGTPV